MWAWNPLKVIFLMLSFQKQERGKDISEVETFVKTLPRLGEKVILLLWLTNANLLLTLGKEKFIKFFRLEII